MMWKYSVFFFQIIFYQNFSWKSYEDFSFSYFWHSTLDSRVWVRKNVHSTYNYLLIIVEIMRYRLVRTDKYSSDLFIFSKYFLISSTYFFVGGSTLKFATTSVVFTIYLFSNRFFSYSVLALLYTTFFIFKEAWGVGISTLKGPLIKLCGRENTHTDTEKSICPADRMCLFCHS